MSLINFLFVKPLIWASQHLVGVEKAAPVVAAVTNKLAPAAQQALDNAKPRIVASINFWADNEAETIVAKTFESDGLRNRLHSVISRMGLGAVITAEIEAAVYSIALPAGAGITIAQIRSTTAKIVAAIEAL